LIGVYGVLHPSAIQKLVENCLYNKLESLVIVNVETLDDI